MLVGVYNRYTELTKNQADSDSFQDFIREVDPDIIIGYNICKFDLPYLIEVQDFVNTISAIHLAIWDILLQLDFIHLQRAEVLKIVEFPILGRIKNSRVRVRDTTFSSRLLPSHSSLY